jgi:outer membrane lipoprotein-sorting protein
MNPLLSRWLKEQTNVHSWSADLVQTRTLKSLTEPLTASGHLWFAEPNRFHWELGKPAQTIAVRGTNEMLVIYPRLKRVERYPLGGSEAGAWTEVLALLEAGFPRSEAELTSRFKILSQTITNGTCEVALEPRSAAAKRMMREMRIGFGTNDFALRATELVFADGSTMKNQFTNSVLNASVEPALFSPAIPNDFKVVEPLKK